VSKKVIVIRVNSDPGQIGEGRGEGGQARYEQPMRIKRLVSPAHPNLPPGA